ncbi:uncharacterized protein LOC122322604 [Drosophila grimshawi]|uniref:uncharacterized protein LOC122322604 n=1 Tax=Drosophila grimshawi TaxID=7222 RepID=UPI001C932CBF|nr:uncharacterized protein LOC122322604 [Drosophila grimshawi]
MTAFSNLPITLDFMSNHYFSALICYFSTQYNPKMSFLQCSDNTLMFALDAVCRRLYYNPRLEEISRPYFGSNTPFLLQLASVLKFHWSTHILPLFMLRPSHPILYRSGKTLLDDSDKFMRQWQTQRHIHATICGTMKKLAIVDTLRQMPDNNFIWKFDRLTI